MCRSGLRSSHNLIIVTVRGIVYTLSKSIAKQVYMHKEYDAKLLRDYFQFSRLLLVCCINNQIWHKRRTLEHKNKYRKVTKRLSKIT